MTAIQDFSSGYLTVEMTVVPYEDGPVAERGFYDYLQRNYYAQTDAPPKFRLGLDGEPYFEVDTEVTMPADHLAIPEEWFEDARMEKKYGKHQVFILKPGHAHLLEQSDKLGERFNPKDLEDDV